MRKKISITVNPELLGAVDAFVANHAEYDRSRVFDDALYLWYAHQQDKAMEAQFLAPASATELEEHAGWHRIQSEAAKRIFGLD